jgi:hypothetical protein
MIRSPSFSGRKRVKVIVHGKGNLKEFESVGINMLERVLLLLIALLRALMFLEP